MSLEGSAPLSQNPEGNTAAAISDVNDNRIIAQERTARIKAMLYLFDKQRNGSGGNRNDGKRRYSYKPEHSRLRGQAGAAIASKKTISR